MAAFHEGEFPVFLLSLKAAGTGLNLTRATHYDRWWNPAVEDKVARLLGAKRALSDQVIASSEAALAELSDADLAELVALSKGFEA